MTRTDTGMDTDMGDIMIIMATTHTDITAIHITEHPTKVLQKQ